MKTKDSITLNIYAPRATKRYETVNVRTKNGKMHVKSLLTQYRLKSFRYFDDNSILQFDDDGWSLWSDFVPGEVYRLRKIPDEGFDETIPFSEASLENVQLHFGLEISEDCLEKEDLSIIDIPEQLFHSIELLASRNTLASEPSRRTIISLFILYALEHVDLNNKLVVHEEMNFTCVREEGEMRYKYNGPVDFAVGHSPVDSKLSKDCALLIVEAKTVSKLGDALAQTLAQVATNYFIRREEKRGNTDNSLRAYWSISDGESWRFGFVEGYGGKLKVNQTHTMTTFLRRPKPIKSACSELFTNIVHWIEKSIESSPTTSRTNLKIVENLEMEDLDSKFLYLDIVE